jgi:hypothetical protein
VTSRVVSVGLLVLAACNESRWIDTHATQLHVGPWVAAIPEHWRDIHELRDPPKLAAAPGGRTLIYDSYSEAGQIDVYPMAVINDREGCSAFAELVREQAKSTSSELVVSDEQPATFAGDRGCLMRLRIGRDWGLLAIRTRAGQAVAIRCLGKDSRLDGSGACDQVVYGINIP